MEAVEAVAELVATGAVQGLSGQAAIDTVAAVVRRIREVFGHDRRSVDTLEQVTAQPTDSAHIAQLAEALHWYAERDAAFAEQLERWAALATNPLTQHVRAGRDAYTAGRDQTIIRVEREES